MRELPNKSRAIRRFWNDDMLAGHCFANNARWNGLVLETLYDGSKYLIWEAGLAQWWKHSLAWVWFPDSCHMWVVGSLKFSTPVFPSPQKPTFPNFSSIRMQDFPENHFGEWSFLGKHHDLFIYLFIKAWLWGKHCRVRQSRNRWSGRKIILAHHAILPPQRWRGKIAWRVKRMSE